MKCRVCGSKLQAVTTDLPFKVNVATIVIMKGLPVYQCENCGEYLIEDPVLEKVEGIIQKVDDTSELEIIRYAA
jgi:YgiT-type zinc finger domain-containing protein